MFDRYGVRISATTRRILRIGPIPCPSQRFEALAPAHRRRRGRRARRTLDGRTCGRITAGDLRGGSNTVEGAERSHRQKSRRVHSYAAGNDDPIASALGISDGRVSVAVSGNTWCVGIEIRRLLATRRLTFLLTDRGELTETRSWDCPATYVSTCFGRHARLSGARRHKRVGVILSSAVQAERGNSVCKRRGLGIDLPWDPF